MISEYKFYHGAVLSELVDLSDSDLSIGELHEEGRLTSYTVNKRLGLHIKHSTRRLPPWQFTITRANLLELLELRQSLQSVFTVFVCDDVGIVALSIEELISIIDANQSEQSWVRLDRRRGGLFSVIGNGGKLAKKKSGGVNAILCALNQPQETAS